MDLCEDSLVEIASHCDNTSVLVGMPAQKHEQQNNQRSRPDRGPERSNGMSVKTIDSRDELFHLSSSKGCEYIKIRGTKVAVVVGSDIKTEQRVRRLCRHYRQSVQQSLYAGLHRKPVRFLPQTRIHDG
ncbi:MAG: hypothetical protein ACLTZY_15195 [Alistipes indistinctus]